MMTNKAQPDKETLDWLLSSDLAGVKYLAVRELTGMAEDDPEMQAARRAAYSQGPIANILNNYGRSRILVRARSRLPS